MKTFKTRNPLLYGLKVLVLSSLIAITSAAINLPAYAEDGKVKESMEAKVEAGTQKQTAEKREKIASEALTALQETSNALKALDNGNTKEAIASLEKATGKVEIVLARNPNLAFAPVEVSSTSQTIITSIDQAKRIVNTAREFLDDGEIQKARTLLASLASETRITVTSLPMATYPTALKEAAALIEEGNIEEAKIVLQVALNTLAVDVTIIPIPVANAEFLLSQAKALAENADRTEAQNKELSELLNTAEDEIKFAQVLGYGNKKDFSGFYKEIETIRKKTSDGKSGTDFFKKIVDYMSSMMTDSQPKPSNN